VGEGRSGKTGTTETSAAVHSTEVRTAMHRAELHAATMHPTAHATSHSTPMHSTSHSASHSAAMPAASAHSTATAATQCRRGKTKRRRKGARNEAIKDLVVHPNSSSVELPRRFSPQREDANQSQRVQCFKMTNVTVSNTKISFGSGGL
jgi:hypothetical protein